MAQLVSSVFGLGPDGQRFKSFYRQLYCLFVVLQHWVQIIIVLRSISLRYWFKSFTRYPIIGYNTSCCKSFLFQTYEKGSLHQLQQHIMIFSQLLPSRVLFSLGLGSRRVVFLQVYAEDTEICLLSLNLDYFQKTVKKVFSRGELSLKIP